MVTERKREFGNVDWYGYDVGLHFASLERENFCGSSFYIKF